MVEQTNVTLEKKKRPNGNQTTRLHCANIQQIHGDTHGGAPKSNATEKPLMYEQQNMRSVKTAERHIQSLSHGLEQLSLTSFKTWWSATWTAQCRIKWRIIYGWKRCLGDFYAKDFRVLQNCLQCALSDWIHAWEGSSSTLLPVPFMSSLPV